MDSVSPGSVCLNNISIFTMKKLLFIILLCVSISAQAQVSVLPKAGFAISDVLMDEENFWYGSHRSKLGFTGGIAVNYRFKAFNILSVQPEILYTQKGFAAKWTDNNMRFNGRYNLNYLEVPVLLRADFDLLPFKIYVYMGPGLSYILNGRVIGEGEVGSATGQINEQVRFTEEPRSALVAIEDLKADRIEVIFNTGLGFGYTIGRSVLFFDTRYNLGLTDYDRDNFSRNKVWAFTFGMQLPLGY
jgi:hypothetical protein